MSWLADFTSPGGPPKGPIQKLPGEDDGPKVEDATGRMVAPKYANQPYLAHKQWRDKEEARKAAKAQRRKERAEKLANGEEVGPEEPDEDQEIGVMGLLKFLFYVAMTILLASKFITGNWLYNGKWLKLDTYLPAENKYFSESVLAKYDGSDPKLPIYLAIDGMVYDVSEGARTYGKGGSYNHMAGVDATRAFGTGCFGTHRTHDLRGLTQAELKGIKHWIQFFSTHKSYRRVGKVIHPDIDPNSPIPVHCNPPPDEAEGSGDTGSPNGKKQHQDL